MPPSSVVHLHDHAAELFPAQLVSHFQSLGSNKRLRCSLCCFGIIVAGLQVFLSLSWLTSYNWARSALPTWLQVKAHHCLQGLACQALPAQRGERKLLQCWICTRLLPRPGLTSLMTVMVAKNQLDLYNASNTSAGNSSSWRTSHARTAPILDASRLFQLLQMLLYHRAQTGCKWL